MRLAADMSYQSPQDPSMYRPRSGHHPPDLSVTSKGPVPLMTRMNSVHKQTKALTWNMAAINNNPFEYWITTDDVEYNNLMKAVSDFIQTPSVDKDVPVSNVITEDMFKKLTEKMTSIGWTGIEEVKTRWDNEYKNRTIISGFIKDPLLGKKRLASMPDRVTNTIMTVDQGTVTRPTVINCYEGDLSNGNKWFDQWLDFVFTKKVQVNKKGTVKTSNIYELFQPIKQSKYPSITTEEEKISIPLQTMALAIFDGILVHMLNQLSPSHWQRIRTDICSNLNKKKSEHSLTILENTYGDYDVAFLQEVSGNFKILSQNRTISEKFDIFSPTNMDTERDQNSFIMLTKGRFHQFQDETAEVLHHFDGMESPVVAGDLFVMSATDKEDGDKFLFASFHGDTNGLATIPVVTAVHNYTKTVRPNHKLLFGMDANTYEKPEKDQQGVAKFVEFFTSLSMKSCWRFTALADFLINYTTYCARTHLQPQLNKAASITERDTKGDKNPKDFMLFYQKHFSVVSSRKDNTGQGSFTEEMVFPTLSFPSDHAITSTVLTEL